ncbi:MAG: hypothetical protein AAFZ38_03695 [Myxococcota bacterium]
MSQKTCKRHELLAKNDFGHIAQCACGTAHINLGPMTLRIPAHSLEAVAELFAKAASVQAELAQATLVPVDPQLAH